jgi:hypothetical protein
MAIGLPTSNDGLKQSKRHLVLKAAMPTEAVLAMMTGVVTKVAIKTVAAAKLPLVEVVVLADTAVFLTAVATVRAGQVSTIVD